MSWPYISSASIKNKTRKTASINIIIDWISLNQSSRSVLWNSCSIPLVKVLTKYLKKISFLVKLLACTMAKFGTVLKGNFLTHSDSHFSYSTYLFTILYCTILYYTILYYTILYYIILYYTILGAKGRAMPAGS